MSWPAGSKSAVGFVWLTFRMGTPEAWQHAPATTSGERGRPIRQAKPGPYASICIWVTG